MRSRLAVWNEKELNKVVEKALSNTNPVQTSVSSPSLIDAAILETYLLPTKSLPDPPQGFLEVI